jgi:hypothetical protein
MTLLLFSVSFFLAITVTLLLLISIYSLVRVKFRIYLKKLIAINFFVFIALLFFHLLTYWDFVSVVNDKSDDGMFLDWYPFPIMVKYTFLCLLPCFVSLFFVNLFLSKKERFKGR